MSNEPVISAEDEGYLRAIEPNLEVRDEPEPAHALDLARAEATWGFRTVIPTIDKAFASPERCDVGKTAFIYFHLGWGNGTSIDEGLIKLDGHEYEANSTGWIAIGETCDSPRKTQWGVSSIDVYGWTEFSQIVDDPSVIWDTVSLYIEPDQRVSSLEDVEWSGVYEYNNEKFVGTVFFNDTLNQGVGEYGLSVTRIKDNKYGLTSFKAVELKIILDKVVIEIFNDTPRVNVGGTPELESTILELQQRIADYHSQTESLTSQIQVIEADKEDLEAEGLRLEAELAEAEAQLGEARSAKQSLESQATSLQNRITSLNAEIQTKATEITRLSDEKKALEKQASNLQATVESQSTRIFNLESERSKILGIVVTQHYEHVYGG